MLTCNQCLIITNPSHTFVLECSKDKIECSQAIINPAKEAKRSNLSVRDGLRKIGAAFLSTREVSAQECVHRRLPELWLRKIFPKTLFVSTDIAENRVRFAKKQQEIDELDDDSSDILKSNIIDRYSDRPKNIPLIKGMCLALFAPHYFKDYSKEIMICRNTKLIIRYHTPDKKEPEKYFHYLLVLYFPWCNLISLLSRCMFSSNKQR